MARTEGVDQISIIATALIFVSDQQRDWRTCGPSLEYPREDFDRIRLLPLSHVARSTGLAPVEIFLDIFS